jgi:hypothetical protein
MPKSRSERREQEEIFDPAKIRSPNPVAICYTDCAILAPMKAEEGALTS